MNKKKLLEWLRKRHFNEASDHEPERAAIYWGVIEGVNTGTFDDHSTQEEIAKLRQVRQNVAEAHADTLSRMEARATQAEQELEKADERFGELIRARLSIHQREVYDLKMERDALHHTIADAGPDGRNYTNNQFNRLQAERDEIQKIAAGLATEQKYAKKQADLWNEEAVRFKAERDALLEGLKWYADEENYVVPFNGPFRSGNENVVNDAGSRARSTIANLAADNARRLTPVE